jgi:hypothetical protein
MYGGPRPRRRYGEAEAKPGGEQREASGKLAEPGRQRHFTRYRDEVRHDWQELFRRN